MHQLVKHFARLAATIAGAALAIAAVAIAAVAQTLHAQSARGTVTVIGSLQPVAGAVVTATSTSGVALVQTITNDRGQYTVLVPDSATQLRIVRIGFRPRVVPLPRLREDVMQIDVSLALLATMLDVFEVRDNSSCSPRRDRAAALALFEQVRHGLLATIVAREALPARLTLLRFHRYMVERSGRIRSQDVVIDSVASQTRPFLAVRTAREFVDRGFVRDSADDLVFLAPDAESMLDDAFRLGYCFRVLNADRTRRGQVGLAFSVARRQAGKVDIDGAIWVDTAARSLTSIEYRYVGLDARRQAFAPGGRVEFRAMPNGAVLIDRWSLRLVALQIDSVRRAGLRPLLRTLYEIHETGGELAQAQWEDGTTWQASLGTLRVAARTDDGLPAAGTRLQLENTDYQGTLDAAGQMRFDNVLPGPYRVLVLDSLLARIDVAFDARIPFTAARDSVHMAEFVVPTPLDYARSVCPAEPDGGHFSRYDPDRETLESIPRQRDRGVAFFVYVTTPNGTPVPGLAITEAVARQDRVPTWHAKATGGTTDSGGRYFSCWNFHLGETVQLWIRPEGQDAQLTLLPMTQRVRALRIVVTPDR